MERLRKEYAESEAEYNEAIKNGAVVPEAPKRGRGTGAGKGAGFFDVVKKAQSSLWEDKFRAFKEKQRESASVSCTTASKNTLFAINIVETFYLKAKIYNQKTWSSKCEKYSGFCHFLTLVFVRTIICKE